MKIMQENTGKIIVQPMGGLANRMRVLAFCFYITQKHNARLECKWMVNEELQAPFESIFKSVNFYVENVYGTQYLLKKSRRWWRNIPAYYYLLKERIDLWLPSNYADEVIDPAKDDSRREFCRKIEDALIEGKTVYLATGNYLGEYTDISFFSPIESILQNVEKCLTLFEKGHSYGLHIRRTDNEWSIKHSPIELFENKINEIIKQDTRAKFYLATDDQETANLMTAKYGKHIVYKEKELTRKSENGIKEAVADMWILGHMDTIYGSYWSSFSEVASWINNKPLYCISDESI